MTNFDVNFNFIINKSLSSPVGKTKPTEESGDVKKSDNADNKYLNTTTSKDDKKVANKMWDNLYIEPGKVPNKTASQNKAAVTNKTATQNKAVTQAKTNPSNTPSSAPATGRMVKADTNMTVGNTASKVLAGVEYSTGAIGVADSVGVKTKGLGKASGKVSNLVSGTKVGFNGYKAYEAAQRGDVKEGMKYAETAAENALDVTSSYAKGPYGYAANVYGKTQLRTQMQTMGEVYDTLSSNADGKTKAKTVAKTITDIPRKVYNNSVDAASETIKGITGDDNIVSDVVDYIASSFKAINNWGFGHSEESKQDLKKLDQTGKSISNRVGSAVNTAKNAAKSAMETVDDVAGTAGNIAKKTVKTIDKAVDKAVDKAGNVAKKTVKTIDKAVDKAVDKAGNVAKKTVKTIDKAVDKAGGIAKNAAKSALNTVSQGFSTVRGWFS